jgi:hypothetical protein
MTARQPRRTPRRPPTPATGPAVFVPHDDTGQVVPLMLDGKRIGSVRLPGVQAPKDLSPDEYCSGKREDAK